MDIKCKKDKKGWILSGAYLKYKAHGGKLSPQGWNDRLKELKWKGK